MYKDKDKQRLTTRERVRRYREKQRGVTANKMICRCKYYKIVNDQLVCIQCGRPAQLRAAKRFPETSNLEGTH